MKGPVEITDIVKPAKGGNLRYFFVRLREQLAAFHDTDADEVFEGRAAGEALKTVAVITFAEAGVFCKVGEGQSFIVMRHHVVQAFLQLGGFAVRRSFDCAGKVEIIQLLPADEERPGQRQTKGLGRLLKVFKNSGQ